MERYIKIRGAREHNLKNIDIDIPKNNLVVITGPSGSGKSSLAFDTIYAEGKRRYVESLSSYARQFLDMQDKAEVDLITGLSPAIAIEQKTTYKGPSSTVATTTEIYDYLRLLFARIGIPHSPATGKPIKNYSTAEIIDEMHKISPPGTKLYIMAPIKPDTIAILAKEGYMRFQINGIMYDAEQIPPKNSIQEAYLVIDRILTKEEIDPRISASIETASKIGNSIVALQTAGGITQKFAQKSICPESNFCITEMEPVLFSFNSPKGACETCNGLGMTEHLDLDLIIPDKSCALIDGAIKPWSGDSKISRIKTLEKLATRHGFSLENSWQELNEENQQLILHGSFGFEGVVPSIYTARLYKKYQRVTRCAACKGYRLRPEALCVKIADYNISQLTELNIKAALEWISNLRDKLNETENKIAGIIIQEITKRISFLSKVGLDYLTLNRRSGTLSGGEMQRIRLASQIGSGLTGVLYVLDEPSIGLHQSDNAKLIATLKSLRNLENSVIVVEHDEETILSADYVIDIGPSAGKHGGKIMATGTPAEIQQNESSITGAYLSGRRFIPVPKNYRPGKSKVIKIFSAKANNLKNIDVEFPLGKLICVTGVSGSGKSSIVIHTLYKAANIYINEGFAAEEPNNISGLEHINKVIKIDQSPIGRTPRSNPATYSGLFDPIRLWFAALPAAKMRGYSISRFSFNVKEGRCNACEGNGSIKIEMHFLPDVYVECDVCKGKRYNQATLQVKYKDKNIADVLDMTINQATSFFSKIPAIKSKLETLQEVGLEYIKIGQSATELSGGEAQRIKLAKELTKKATGNTLYILDEPTTGLHAEDIKKLLKVLHKFADLGNTVVIIEHNLEVIKTADHIIDVGPGGGEHGGLIIAQGTPKEIANNPHSLTGKYLKPYLKKRLEETY
jgi:excinuclease ABC subunit A